MRFITEFKVPTGMSKEGNPTYIQTWRSNMQLKLGTMIAESFDWQNPTNHNPAHHRLEIEAFPIMDYLDFKANLINYLVDKGINPKVIQDRFSILESIGKPSGDAITNQQLNK